MPTPKRTKPALPPFARPLLAGALAATALSAIDAQAAIFLKITGPEIKGESTNAKHKDEIVVTSFARATRRRSRRARRAARAPGRSACAPVEMTKQLDLASGPLINAVMKGTVAAEVGVQLHRERRQPAGDYYVVTLSNSLVSSVAQSSGGDRPGESVELVPRQVELKYFRQDENGRSMTVANTTVVDCTSFKVLVTPVVVQ